MEVSNGWHSLGAARRCPVPEPAPNKGMQATAYSLRLAGLGSGFPPRLMPGVRCQRLRQVRSICY